MIWFLLYPNLRRAFVPVNFQLMVMWWWFIFRLQAFASCQFVALEMDANRLPAQAKEIIYRAFIEDEFDAPKHLARVIHHEYFEPAFPDFAPRTKWSLQNAFTSGFKLLEPVPQFKATASFGEFFNSLN
jgi:hypothetical protein